MRSAALILLLTGIAASAQAQEASRVTVGLDYLAWWAKGAPLGIPLVSSGPPSNYNGFLLNSGTTILYGAPYAPATGGNAVQNFAAFSGARLTVTAMVDPARSIAVEASGFGLASNTAGYTGGGSGGTLGVGDGVRIPFYNAVPYYNGVPIDEIPTENGLPVALPGIIGGQVRITNRLSLWGIEAMGTIPIYRAPNWSLTAVAGLRLLELTEDFDLTDSFYGIIGPFVGQSGVASDHFGTSNRFIGPAIGVRATTGLGPFSLTGTVRMAVGDMTQELNVAGAYQAVDYTPSAGPEGIFAQPANEGRRTKDAFAVAPDLQVKLGYDVTPWARLTIGYDFLYLNDVVRPGDQLDHTIPKGQTFQQGGSAVSTTLPAKLFRTSDFYAQGLTAGVSVRF